MLTSVDAKLSIPGFYWNNIREAGKKTQIQSGRKHWSLEPSPLTSVVCFWDLLSCALLENFDVKIVSDVLMSAVSQTFKLI